MDFSLIESEAVRGLLQEHSGEASPSFWPLEVPSSGKFALDYADALDSGEQLRSMWDFREAIICVRCSEDGAPCTNASVGQADDGVVTYLAAHGNGTIHLTDRRLFGIVVPEADSPFAGAYGRDPIWFSLPLSDLARVALMREKGLFGPKKGGSLQLRSKEGGAIFASLVDYVPESQPARTEGSADFLELIMTAAVATQRHDASDADRAALDMVAAGDVFSDGVSIVAPLTGKELAEVTG